jgi:hypothetical protein
MYVFVNNIHTYRYVCMYIPDIDDAHIYVYIYIYMCMHVCMYVCMYVYTYIRMYVCMYVYIFASSRAQAAQFHFFVFKI